MANPVCAIPSPLYSPLSRIHNSKTISKMMIEGGSKSDMCGNTRSAKDGVTEAQINKCHTNDIEITKLPVEQSLEDIADGEKNSGHVVEIDTWATSLATILDVVPQYMCTPGHPARISRVPEILREVDMKSYEPYILSLGPYHHGKPRVQRMEKQKLAILKCVLEQKPEIKLKEYLKEIKSMELEVRKFYSHIDMESDKFVQMLLLDSLYVVIFFCGMTKGRDETSVGQENTDEVTQMNEYLQNEQDNENTRTTSGDEPNNEKSEEDVKHTPRWIWTLLAHDLVLIENQLPFFLLQKIHDLVHASSVEPLIHTLKYEFGKLLSPYTRLNSDMVISPSEDVHHLLHLCHMFFRPTIEHHFSTCQISESTLMFRLESAVQLYEAGVTFEVRSGSRQHSLLDVTIGSSGKIIMPCLHVEDNTVSLLRNLIALEQMKYPSMGLDVSAYAVLLLHLITIPEDVKLLRRKGIIQHHLASDKEMVYLVNRLSVGLSFDYVEDKYNLKPVFHELKRYSERRVPKWSAGLKHRYFNNPWTTISLLAASLLLLLTVVQTYYTIYSYYHPFFDGQN